MGLYVGLDVSLKRTSVCVIDGAGKVVWRGTASTSVEALAAVLQKQAPQAERIGLESGSMTPFLWHGLRMQGFAVVCLDARWAKKALAEVRRLMSVPGIGPITALAYRAAIDDPTRFAHSRDVGAYLGLTPKRYQSGVVDRDGGISKCGDHMARGRCGSLRLHRSRLALPTPCRSPGAH